MVARILLIPAAPLLGAMVLALGGRFISARAHLVGVTAAGLAFLGTLALYPAVSRGATFTVTVYEWLPASTFRVSVTLAADPLTIVMLLLVTGVGFLIHVYSIGYMHGDPGYARYFAYLNFFLFSMIMLVLAANYLLLYIFWEAVGLSSYLLIGFWYQRPAAARAATKAFIVNRVGDFGFLLGILWIATALGTVEYGEVFRATEGLPVATATGISLLLFLGAAGKSAQLPLHVWLPDAMEGPTPVSALIHAATMVTAGVYVVARSHVLFERSGMALEVVAWVGALTALFAATVALVQTDIKRVLAYSTISQLGYMFVGLGVRAYAAGMFHLLTQGFFKALLFLGAGSVIHALGGEQRIDRMGGLAPRMRVTCATFAMGALAMAGIPPFSGFFSKDAVLAGAFFAGHTLLWLLGLVTAFLTALYTLRLVFLTFFGAPRTDPVAVSRVHESPSVMTAPMVILAVASATAGLLGLQAEGGMLDRFLAPVFYGSAGREPAAARVGEWALAAGSAAIAAVGTVAAWWIYLHEGVDRARLRKKFARLHDLMENAYAIDRLYDRLLVLPLFGVARACARAVDARLVDGAVNGLGRGALKASGLLRQLQTGFVVNYALAMLLGAVAMLAYFILGR